MTRRVAGPSKVYPNVYPDGRTLKTLDPEITEVIDSVGGRTRTRTWDPLIKS